MKILKELFPFLFMNSTDIPRALYSMRTNDDWGPGVDCHECREKYKINNLCYCGYDWKNCENCLPK